MKFKSCMKGVSVLILCMLVLCGWAKTGVGESAQTKTTAKKEASDILPDFGASIFSPGERLIEGYDIDGQKYDAYGYTFDKEESSTIWSKVTAYQWIVKRAGFQWAEIKELSTDNTLQRGDKWYSMENDAGKAYLCVNSSYFSKHCAATLYVPESIPFELKKDVKYKYRFQNPVYLDVVDLPEGEAGEVVCALCHGSGICSFCHGTGSYPNPYYPRLTVTCDCDHGKCSVCDGTGVW